MKDILDAVREHAEREKDKEVVKDNLWEAKQSDDHRVLGLVISVLEDKIDELRKENSTLGCRCCTQSNW